MNGSRNHTYHPLIHCFCSVFFLWLIFYYFTVCFCISYLVSFWLHLLVLLQMIVFWNDLICVECNIKLYARTLLPISLVTLWYSELGKLLVSEITAVLHVIFRVLHVNSATVINSCFYCNSKVACMPVCWLSLYLYISCSMFLGLNLGWIGCIARELDTRCGKILALVCVIKHCV